MKTKKQTVETTPEKHLFFIQNKLNSLYNNYDYITDETLIDSYIYEINSLNSKYAYYLRMCKNKV